jgi:hypothetical protein
MSTFSYLWFSICTKLRGKENAALREELRSLQKRNESLQTLITKHLEQQTRYENKIRILQSVANQRVLSDAERFLEEG